MCDRVSHLQKIQDEARSLFARKNTDYGDAFATHGPIGTLIRIGEKIGRMQSISKRGIALVNDESLRDSLLDLHNYSAMAIMLLDGDNTSEKENQNKNQNKGFISSDNIVVAEAGIGAIVEKNPITST